MVIDQVKETLLNENLQITEIEQYWNSISNKRKMAVWMNLYYERVFNRIESEAIKSNMEVRLQQYNILRELLVNKINALFKNSEFVNEFNKNKKSFQAWVKAKPELKEYRYVLFKIHDSGSLEQLDEFELRRSVFKLVYGRK